MRAWKSVCPFFCILPYLFQLSDLTLVRFHCFFVIGSNRSRHIRCVMYGLYAYFCSHRSMCCCRCCVGGRGRSPRSFCAAGTPQLSTYFETDLSAEEHILVSSPTNWSTLPVHFKLNPHFSSCFKPPTGATTWGFPPVLFFSVLCDSFLDESLVGLQNQPLSIDSSRRTASGGYGVSITVQQNESTRSIRRRGWGAPVGRRPRQSRRGRAFIRVRFVVGVRGPR